MAPWWGGVTFHLQKKSVSPKGHFYPGDLGIISGKAEIRAKNTQGIFQRPEQEKATRTFHFKPIPPHFTLHTSQTLLFVGVVHLRFRGVQHQVLGPGPKGSPEQPHQHVPHGRETLRGGWGRTKRLTRVSGSPDERGSTQRRPKMLPASTQSCSWYFPPYHRDHPPPGTFWLMLMIGTESG